VKSSCQEPATSQVRVILIRDAPAAPELLFEQAANEEDAEAVVGVAVGTSNAASVWDCNKASSLNVDLLSKCQRAGFKADDTAASCPHACATSTCGDGSDRSYQTNSSPWSRGRSGTVSLAFAGERLGDNGNVLRLATQGGKLKTDQLDAEHGGSTETTG
jgi:hypothetical protein